ncbi:MAG: PAS domain S-box protein [Sulfuritalea sp.]|nr:PAS domain S-box protein [Sulfuritalea sp.]
MTGRKIAKTVPARAGNEATAGPSERKRAQEASGASVGFSGRLIESMQEGLSLVDAKGVHLEVNPALCRMTGFSRRELIGSGVPHPYWPPEAEAAIRAAFRKVLEEQASTLELTFMRKNGERFPVIISPSAVKDAQGNILGYMATVKDITERKQIEEKLREMAADLEKMVDQRTKELRALSAQLTMTEERERRMLAQDLHDNLSQLLAIIKIKLSSLVAGSPDVPVNQIIGLVDQAEQSARSITLQLSPPILHTLGFVPALEWLADEMDRVYGIGVSVDTEICQKPFDDVIQTILYRSARELLINVAKHAGVNRANLSCMCSDGRLMLVVSDDGCGFDPAVQGSVLSGQRSFGLNSIYERIANIGGEMDIDSSPGNGTTVSLSVPCLIVTRGGLR